MARLWVLGSGGWMPSGGRETSCFLVEMAGELMLLDAGTGVANLSLVPEVLARHDQLHVLLSHYHLDHVVGLMYLKRFCAGMRVDVYGPGRPVYAHTTEECMRGVLQPSVYSSGAYGFAREVRYHDYGGRVFSVGGVQVGVRPQQHSAPSFELRLDDVLVYATDTCFNVASWQDVKPAQVLLHECWQIENDDPRHTSARALADGLPRDRFEHVLLIHHNPAWSEDERAEVARIAAAAGIELAADGQHIALHGHWGLSFLATVAKKDRPQWPSSAKESGNQR